MYLLLCVCLWEALVLIKFRITPVVKFCNPNCNYYYFFVVVVLLLIAASRTCCRFTDQAMFHFLVVITTAGFFFFFFFSLHSNKNNCVNIHDIVYMHVYTQYIIYVYDIYKIYNIYILFSFLLLLARTFNMVAVLIMGRRNISTFNTFFIDSYPSLLFFSTYTLLLYFW